MHASHLSGGVSRPSPGPPRPPRAPTRVLTLRRPSRWPSSPVAVTDGGSESSSPGENSRNPRRPLTSSERGVLFRRRERERERALAADTERLRREVARLQALKAVRESALLAQSFIEGGSPLRFAREYFAQFRFGVAGVAGVATAETTTTTSRRQQEAFMEALVEPGTVFGGRPATAIMLAGLAKKTMDHSSFRLECGSMQLVEVDTDTVVVTTGFNHLRVSRRTLQQQYPHVLHDEALAAKLVGRQLHVPFTMRMFFGQSGRLVKVEIESDFVSALYEVLRDADECAFVLGQARVRKVVVGPHIHAEDSAGERWEPPATRAASRFEELAEPEDEPQQTAPASPPVPSSLAFLLS